MNATKLDLMEMDCVAGMKKLPAESVHLVVTSPPYNLGVEYAKYDDRQNREDYLEWSLSWAEQVHRLLCSNGSLFLNVGAAPSNPMLPHQLVAAFSKLFCLQNTFHWIKSITIQTRDGATISAGHFKPIRSHRFVNDCHEYVFHLTKTGNTPIDRLGVGVPYTDKSNIRRWSHTEGKDKRCRGNTWFIPYDTIHNREEQRPHPATFPKELAIQCIRLHGWRSDLVMLDPFLGLGSSALAAQECGIEKFIGFEIDKDYLTIAIELLKEARGRHPTLDLSHALNQQKHSP